MPLLTDSCTAGGGLYVGKQLFRRMVVRDEDGVLTDVVMEATLTEPDGNVIDLESLGNISHDSLGTYTVMFPPFDQRGIHSWRIAAVGPVYDVDQGTLRVAP